MPIAILALALAAYALALVIRPGFRRWGLVGGAAVGLGLAVYFWNSGESNPVLIRPEQLTLDQLDLERTPRGARMTGRVLNGSPAFRLRDMTIDLRLHDCPVRTMEARDCPVIGQSRAIARPDVPPGQIRAFVAAFTFANLPPLLGTLTWDWEIVETRATAN